METSTMKHLRHAAESGEAAAQFNLGVLSDSRVDDNGYAIEGNRTEAIKWLLAILNIAINARDAMMPGGGVLTIDVWNAALQNGSDEDGLTGDFVAVAISDTGAGMSAEILQCAFEPFFTTKGEGLGTGLGLSMVAGFAKQSGGTAHINSEIGRGTSVTIYLPRTTTDLQN